MPQQALLLDCCQSSCIPDNTLTASPEHPTSTWQDKTLILALRNACLVWKSWGFLHPRDLADGGSCCSGSWCGGCFRSVVELRGSVPQGLEFAGKVLVLDKVQLAGTCHVLESLIKPPKKSWCGMHSAKGQMIKSHGIETENICSVVTIFWCKVWSDCVQ